MRRYSLALIVLDLVALYISSASEPNLQLTLYLKDRHLTKGQSSSIVIEIDNLGDEGISIAKTTEIKIKYAGSALPEPQDAEHFFPAEQPVDGVLHGAIVVLQPEGSSKHLAPLTTNDGEGSEIIPHKSSKLCKMVIPQEAFEVGLCSVKFVVQKGKEIIAGSNAQQIECKEKDADLKGSKGDRLPLRRKGA